MYRNDGKKTVFFPWERILSSPKDNGILMSFFTPFNEGLRMSSDSPIDWKNFVGTRKAKAGEKLPALQRPFSALQTETDSHEYVREMLERSRLQLYALLYAAQGQSQAYSNFLEQMKDTDSKLRPKLWLRCRLSGEASLEMAWLREAAYRVSMATAKSGHGRFFTKKSENGKGRTQYYMWAPTHLKKGAEAMKYSSRAFKEVADWEADKAMSLEEDNEKLRKMARQLGIINRALFTFDRLASEYYGSKIPAQEQDLRLPPMTSAAFRSPKDKTTAARPTAEDEETK